MARNSVNPAHRLADGFRDGLSQSLAACSTFFSRLGWGCLIMAANLISGCEVPLFTAEASRTPYERYQQLHGEQRSGTEENAYGGQQPALRDRLRPLDRN